jgi:propanediol dehydratase small subunit
MDEDDREALAQREAENGIENLERAALTFTPTEVLDIYQALKNGKGTTEDLNEAMQTIYNKRKQGR